ncbi:hypothetical protein FJZ31_42640 [Candidatus Poribacteria bacterium]|nr:hypothetical protein [Candidatus Poribacteria bacterium]
MRHFQIIVDENMPRRFTLMLQYWVSAGQIGSEVGRKGIQDDEIIPRILLEVKRTTFLTQDRRIYFRERPHPGYCLIIVPELSVSEIAALVRRLFRVSGFHTVAERMGKIVRITQEYIHWKELYQPGEQRQQWPLSRKR